MNWKYITLNEEYIDNHIIILTLNNPKTLNAINKRMLVEIKEGINTVNNMNDVRVLVFQSAFNKAFSTGIDTAYVKSLSNEDAANFFSEIAELLNKIEKLPYITIAGVSGYAYGAGGDLALACDIRLGQKNTVFRFPGSQFGVILGTMRLINEIGFSKSRYLTMTNKIIERDEALEYGLLHHINNDSELFSNLLEEAIKLSQVPKHSINVIKSVTNSNQEEKEIIKLTSNSILEQNFKENFINYLL